MEFRLLYHVHDLFVADPCMHSYTVDGLPTLKIQTLNQSSIYEHRRANTLPTPLRNIRRKHRRTIISQALIAPKVNYAQMSLEEEDAPHLHTDLDEISFKPVLIWKPSMQKKSPPNNRRIVASKHTEPSNTLAMDATLSVSIPGVPSKRDEIPPTPCEGRRSSMPVFKTNLTDTLPPCKKGQGKKVCTYS